MMLPIFEPVMLMFQPVVAGLLGVAAVAVGGVLVLVALVAMDAAKQARSRDRREVAHLPEAA